MADDIETINFNNIFIAADGSTQATYSGVVNVDFTNNTVVMNGLASSFVLYTNGQPSQTYGGPPNASLSLSDDVYTITGYGGVNNASITFKGSHPTQNSAFFSNPTIGSFNTLNNPAGMQMQALVETPVCFASGTSVLCKNRAILVQNLGLGDVILTTSGEDRAIRWLGHRTIDCARHPRPHEVMPVRISAHAFAENRPSRDLCVSPGHAICIDAVGEVLIPAAALVNGTTIVQEHVDIITYWHVELEGGHNIILAENLPCESYIEMGNRSFFAETQATALHANPDASVITHDDFCRPFHRDGPLVAFVRERLAARSPDLGWTLKQEPFANIHLIVDGQRVEAETNGLTARFLMPASAKEVWLMSDTSVPAEIGLSPDLRSLGVCVGSIVIDDGFGSPSTIKADHPLLSLGFHNIEDGPQRWTAGRSRLPAELWQGCYGSFFLRVDLTRPALPRWVMTASATGEDLKKPIARS